MELEVIDGLVFIEDSGLCSLRTALFLHIFCRRMRIFKIKKNRLVWSKKSHELGFCLRAILIKITNLQFEINFSQIITNIMQLNDGHIV